MLIPDIYAFEERAALAQFEGGSTKKEAEDLAAHEQLFADADAYWQWLTDYAAGRSISY